MYGGLQNDDEYNEVVYIQSKRKDLYILCEGILYRHDTSILMIDQSLFRFIR